MDSLEQFVDVVFGGKITVDQIVTMLVAVYAVIKSFTEWRAKKKLINADKTLTATEEKLEAQQEEIQGLKTACIGLVEVVTTAYLSSNTIDAETKKDLAAISNKLKENSNLSLSAPVTALIEKVEQGANVDLSEIKKELKEKFQDTETILNVASETAQAAIDKLKV